MIEKQALSMKVMCMLVALVLVINLAITAAPSQLLTAAGPAKTQWERLATPTEQGWVLAPDSMISDYAVASEGEIAYAIVVKWSKQDEVESYYPYLLKSTDHAATWRDITSGVRKEIDRKELGWLCDMYKVATAPDDQDFVAVALWLGDYCHELHVFISNDGGTTFRDTGAVADATDQLFRVYDFAISPVDKDEWRDMAIGGVGTRGRHIWRARATGHLATSWEDATTYPGWDDRDPNTMATGFDSAAVVAIKFAPSWDADKTILIATVTGWGPYNSVHLQSGTWDTDMVEAWNGEAGFSPAVVIVGYVFIEDLWGYEAGITLPSDYVGWDSAWRYAWVWVNYIDTAATDGPAIGEIYLVDDGYAQAVNEQIRRRPWLSNVSYLGTIAEGKAIAGLLGTGEAELEDAWEAWWPIYSEPCKGVQVYHYDLIGPNMDICCPAWQPACKPPTGSLAMEAFYVTADKAYAVALWDYQPFGEGAWSFSFDDGYSWNQLSLIDTWISYLSDVAVSPNCNKTMAVSINYGPDFDRDDLCDSVWYMAENQTHAPEYSGKWLRTWSGQFSGSNPLYDLKWGLLRLAPEQFDGEAVYLVDLGSNKLYYNGMQTLDCWEDVRSIIDSIIDLAAKDESTIYALGLDGYMAVSDDYGVAPSWTSPVYTDSQAGWTIAVHGDEILVGGQSGEVSYSSDSGRTFTALEDVSFDGFVTVAFDSYFDANSTIYAALYGAEDDSGIYRWVVGDSTGWTNLGAEPYDYTGLVLDNADGNPETSPATGAFLYASYVAEVDGEISAGVTTCANPAAASCCIGDDWNYITQGLTSSEAFAAMPRALKICGGMTVDTSSTLYAIDIAQDYDIEKGRDGAVWGFVTRITWPLANPVRAVPHTVVPGETFEVTVTFTSPGDDFNSAGLSDVVPPGWAATVNSTWTAPPADIAHAPTPGEVAYIWFGPYAADTELTAVYEVQVPLGTAAGSYIFPGGTLTYYVEGVGPHVETIAGDYEVEVVDAVAIVAGETREVNCDILTEVTVTLIQNGTLIASTATGGDGNYLLPVPQFGEYSVVASKDGFRDEEIAISVTESTTYAMCFMGDHGLIPDAPNMSYVLSCINLWQFGEPPCRLTMSRVLAVINAWQFPAADG